jgi:PucR family transcriptional regulator, purine catabolism regulatory protein
MIESSLAYLPSLQQLLETEVFSEAQVLLGEAKLAKLVSQVVSGFSPPPRPDSLVVTRLEAFNAKDQVHFSGLAGIVLVRPATNDSSATNKAIAGSMVGSAVKASLAAPFPLNADASLERLVGLCREAGIVLISIPSFGESGQIAEDIRNAYFKEVKNNGMRLHSHLLKVVLTEGLEGLVEQLSIQTNRPISIETASFQVLASRNMGATPASQQQNVTEQIGLVLNRNKQEESNQSRFIHPVKVGRRLILPILLDNALVGYISAMTKSSDNLEMLAEYLHPAASAATVDFYQRRKDGSIFTVTQKSLLKDLLSGRGLSAADQERVERHYGFDLCDGLLVFAIATTASDQATANWTEENLATTEVEGTRIFVLPYNQTDGKSWQQVAEDLMLRFKQALVNQESKGKVKIQLGAGRLANNILGLAEAYREARQALIIGSMIHGIDEFMIGYGALGVKRLLYLMIDHPELERFYEESLSPLESYDAEWESELVPSLRVYLEQGANLNSAARALFIHRHTLRYRLEQIADILKVDIDSQETLLNLQLAFLIKDMKQGMSTKARA